MNGFPHLNEEEYIRVLRQKISTRQALILKDGGTAIGIMLFSKTGFPLHRSACRKVWGLTRS